MLTSLRRARWLAPAVLLTLTACSPQVRQDRFANQQAQVDPPALWRVDALGPRGEATGAVLICADRPLREGFRRANAEADGRPCLPMGDPVDHGGLYALRCEIEGRRFGLTLNRSGDPDRDFTTRFLLRALDGTGHSASQVRRYRRLGPCPDGWIIGDQARPGSPRGVNALAGTWQSR